VLPTLQVFGVNLIERLVSVLVVSVLVVFIFVVKITLVFAA